MPGKHRIIVPRAQTDELLHRLHVAADERVGHRPGTRLRVRLARQWQQQPLPVPARPMPLLLTAEERGERRMIRDQRVVQRRILVRREANRRRSSRGRGKLLGRTQGDRQLGGVVAGGAEARQPRQDDRERDDEWTDLRQRHGKGQRGEQHSPGRCQAAPARPAPDATTERWQQRYQ